MTNEELWHEFISSDRPRQKRLYRLYGDQLKPVMLTLLSENLVYHTEWRLEVFSYVWLGDHRPATLQQGEEKFSVGRERVRSIENVVFRKFKHPAVFRRALELLG